MPALAFDLLAELAAAGAFAQVPAKIGSAQSATALGRELLADLGAVGLARVAACYERLTGLEHQRLDLLPRNAEHLADLFVAEGIDLGEHERRALVLGQAAHVDDQIAQVLAALHLCGEALGSRLVELGGGLLAARAQDRVAAVARDREQPGAQMDLLLRGDQVVVRRRNVCWTASSASCGSPSIWRQNDRMPAMVAVVDHLERGRASLPDQRHQALRLRPGAEVAAR